MRIPCVCVVALLSAVSSAQTTHIVGPGGFAQVNQALAVAAPGDEIVVQPGQYDAFTVTFDVTVRAATPGTVTIGYVFWSPATRVLLPAAGRVHLRHLLLRGMVTSGGVIMLDACQVATNPTGLLVQGGEVVLQDCGIYGGNQTGSGGPIAGLVATNATITAIDTAFAGGPATSPGDGPTPGYGIHLTDSILFGSGLTVTGGGGSGGYVPKPAVRAIGSSQVWVSDSTLNGGVQVFSATLPPACPIEATAGRLDRCTLVPSTCTVGIPTTGPLLGLHRPAPMTSPGAVSLEFRAAANEPVGVYLSTGLGFATLPLFEQPILLDVANAVPFALLVTDATGLATTGCSIPAGFAGLEFWFQGVSGSALPLQLSPVGGGIVR